MHELTEEQINEWEMWCERAAIDIFDDIYGPTIDRMLESTERLRALALNFHGKACGKCLGEGQYLYPNTSTWRRGGISGQAFTSGVCDVCWGTGRNDAKGVDLRKFDNEMRALKACIKELKEYHGD